MSVMTDSIKKGDDAILYVSPFSKVGADSEYIGDFLECHVLGLMKDMVGDQDDDRVFVRCSRDLNMCDTKVHMYPDEALISVDSPFFMSWDEYDGCKFDPSYLDNWLDVISDAIVFDEELLKVPNSTDIVANISAAFHDEHREAIRFPR